MFVNQWIVLDLPMEMNFRLYYITSPLFLPAVRIWDVQPFAPADRQLKVLTGNQHGFEKVSCTFNPAKRKSFEVTPLALGCKYIFLQLSLVAHT